MTTTPLEQHATEETPVGFSLIDCDVHPHFADGLNTLVPYLDSSWVRRLGLQKRGDWTRGVANAGGFTIPSNGIYNSPAGAMRLDAIPADGTAPSSSPRQVIDELVDPLGIDRAVLLPGNVFGLGAVPNADTASAIARATNDWLDDVWLQADDRFRMAIVAVPQDPVASAAEIRRMAERRGAVQVIIPADRRLLGDPHFYPIYEAAAEHSLPVSVHPTGVESIFVNGPQLPQDPPWYYLEYHTMLTLPHQANAISLIAHGVFERFPNLRMVFTEVGIAWLLEVMWRMDKNWKALRDEVPWVKRLPSEYIADHIRFTTQPFLEPKRNEHLLQFIEMVRGDRLLMFSSDYPHWDGDDPRWTLERLPRDLRRRIAVDNARELYGDRLS